MGEIIAISNQKGGVGKTTTAVNLSASLAEIGKKVLVIDFDPQGNLTSSFGLDKNNLDKTIYEVIITGENIEKAVLNTDIDNLYILTSNINLSGAEIELLDFEKREYILKNILKNKKEEFDYIIIDCPPSLSLLTINALSSSDSVIIPLQCEYYALEGLTQILKTIDLIKNNYNKDLYINGIVFTMYDSRNNLSKEVVDNVKENLDEYVYETIIPRNVRLAEAPSFGMPINIYDNKSIGALSYKMLAEELLRR